MAPVYQTNSPDVHSKLPQLMCFPGETQTKSNNLNPPLQPSVSRGGLLIKEGDRILCVLQDASVRCHCLQTAPPLLPSLVTSIPLHAWAPPTMTASQVPFLSLPQHPSLVLPPLQTLLLKSHPCLSAPSIFSP